MRKLPEKRRKNKCVTDQPTDQRTDIVRYRVACTRLKTACNAEAAFVWSVTWTDLCTDIVTYSIFWADDLQIQRHLMKKDAERKRMHDNNEK